MGKRTRTFVRSVESSSYELDDQRRAQLEAPRVRGSDVVVDDMSVGYSTDNTASRTEWRLAPGDDPLLTQTLQVHFNHMPPKSANHGHGHQNEAVFYILSGSGYEEHDGRQYRWNTDDVVIVHTDSVHRHFNDGEEPAHVMVLKAKSSWMFMGLLQQRSSGPAGAPDPSPVPHEDRFGPREDWSRVWSPGVESMRKIVTPEDTTWEVTRDGIVRWLSAPGMGVRCHSIDLYQQRIPSESRSSRHLHMADEVIYFQQGTGYSLHWEVEAEIADRYYARVAKEPTRHEFMAGDTMYVPQNTIHQHFAYGDTDVLLLSGQNRIFRTLGYDQVAVLDEAPEWTAAQDAGASTATP